MAKPAHTRITFSGVVGSVAAPVERWSFSVCGTPAVMAAAPAQASADALAAGLRNDWNQFINVLPSDVILTEVRVAYITALGQTAQRADGSYDQGVWQGSQAGGGAPQSMPLNVALCVSLLTDRAGATGKGRFFLPWPAYAISATDKRLSSVNTQTMVDVCVLFLNAVNARIAGSLGVVSSKGYITDVKRIRIGRVPDTMRSRRESTDEGYVAAPLA